MIDNNDNTKNRSDKIALIATIEKKNKIIGDLKSQLKQPIAIIGVSCRLPGGANSLDKYWDLLINGIDAISEVPSDRWSLNEYYDPDPDVPNKMYCKWGGFLDIDVQDFDAKFFDIVSLEAQMMDPQQRLALEVTWEALESSGIVAENLKGTTTGVFFGVSTSDYANLVRDSGDITSYTNSGSSHSVLAGRVSYELGLQGPSLVLDTACSSSLVAIHQACRSLREGESSLAIAGGVNLMLTPDLTIGFCKGRFLAEDGRCKTFDVAANGYVRGEGCGVIILKRLSDAQRDGDNILAIIRGSAVNQDGASSGLTVPNGPAQETVITQALIDANVKPNEISYVEAHGTGTSLGDPIEVNALEHVLKEGRSLEQRLILASVKTNIGHLEAAAGIASVIKVILALKHQKIPKNLHFHSLNHNIHIDNNISVVIPIENTEWPRNDKRRIAGISGFAFQGTNAHLIIEEPSEFKLGNIDVSKSNLDRTAHVLAISAKSDAALQDLVQLYLTLLNRNETSSNYFANLSFSANNFRSQFNQRLAVVAIDTVDAKTKLQAWLNTEISPDDTNIGGISKINPKTVFLFTGQGSQYVGMGKELYESSPTFKKYLDICAESLEKNNYLNKPLLSILWGADSALIDETKYTQPALFAFEYALCQLWLSWGVTPSAVMGHSVGEYVAACVAGIFSLEDGLKLISKRAELMQALPKNGSMAAIAVSEHVIIEAIKPYADQVSIAAINGPESIVISGNIEAVKKLASEFAAKGVKIKELQVSHAFHSHLLEPMLSNFEVALHEIKFSKPNINLISNLTGVAASGDEIITVDYWLKHTRNEVRFNDGIRSLINAGFNNFIEIGPHPVLLVMAQEGIFEFDENKYHFLPSIRNDMNSWTQILESLGNLYVTGVDIDWKSFDSDYTRLRVELPTYPFQRQRYWVDAKSGHNKAVSNINHPILTNRVDLAKDGSTSFGAELSPRYTIMLEEHRVYEVPVLPAVAYLELIMSGASRMLGDSILELEDIGFEKALAVLDDDSVEVQVNFIDNNDNYDFSIYSRRLPIDDATEWNLNVSGVVRTLKEYTKPLPLDIKAIQQRSSDNYTGSTFLNRLHDVGMTFGPRFSSLQHVWVGNGEALGEISLAPEYISEISEYAVYPATFDSGLQLLIAHLPFATTKAVAHLPVGISKLTRYAAATAKSWVYVTWHAAGDETNTVEQKSLRGDIKLLDENGNVLVEVIGLTAVEAPQDAVLQGVQKKSIAPFYETIWKEQPIDNNQDDAHEQLWILFSDTIGVAKLLATMDDDSKLVKIIDVLEQEKYHPDIYNKENYKNIFTEILSSEDVSRQIKIINLLPLNVRDPQDSDLYIIENQKLCYLSTLYIAQTAIDVSKSLNITAPIDLIVVTQGVFESKSIWPAEAWGLGKVLALEANQLHCKLIDVDSKENAANLFSEILFGKNSDNQVALQNSNRFVARLKSLEISTKVSEKAIFDPNGSYWITGGGGGIGGILAAWMLEKSAKNVVLIGRNISKPETQKLITELNAKYSANITSMQLDIADRLAVKNALADNKPKGIIHAAGILEDELLEQQTWESFERVMKPKVLGAWNLHELTSNVELDFLVFFSSQTAVLGNIGQANYAASNAFLDALANYRKARGLHTISIDWGPWLEVGMAARSEYHDELSSQGMVGIKNSDGLLYLETLIQNTDLSNVGVFNINWPVYLDNFYTGVIPSSFDNFTHKKVTNIKKAQTGPKSKILEQLQKASEEQKRTLIQTFLIDELTKLLGPRLKGTVTLSAGFMDLGVDSLLAVEFRKILKVNFDGYAKISPTAAFDYPNIETMGDYILDQISFSDSGTNELVINKPAIKPRVSGVLNEPIAIVGMSCRMPGGANSLDEYWKLLEGGVDAISEVPPDRWSLDEYYDPDPDAPGKMYSKWGGFLKNIDVSEFDAPFFNITPSEARDMDPQQRMLLEVVWEALEIGGINPRSLNKSATAMFVGQGAHDYFTLLFKDFINVSPYTNSGFVASVMAGRVSYTLGLQGPSMAIDTACSSSLIAVHEACNSLHLGEVDMAIAAGVSLLLSPELTVGCCKARMLSEDGRCKTFDAAANGYARGEGCGAVILKRLSDAKRDGDRILAVIKGSATNQDGASGGLTVPNGPAQQAVIRTALQQAGIKPSEVSYVETHGTGTSLGDPIEVQALGSVYGEGRDSSNPITIGSVKTNFGHLEVAAGMASIIKVVLAMQHKKIPKHLNFKTINPMITLEEIPAIIPLETKDWIVNSGTRIAGMSGFAFQGSNAHIIVEEAPEQLTSVAEFNRPQHILCLSAKSNAALRELVVLYREQALNRDNLDIGDICYTANTGRAPFEQKLAVVATTSNEMSDRLESWLKSGEAIGLENAKIENIEQKTAFLFTGQGSQYAGMGKSLYYTNPIFKRALDSCSDILNKNNYLDKPLLSILWGDDSNLIDETKYTQPVLFAIEYSLYQLWSSWNIKPNAVIGHSVGEYVAACVAGVFSLEDGLKLISKRAALMQELQQNGAMAAINTSKSDIESALSNYKNTVSIAAINGPNSIVISGEKSKVLEIVSSYDKKNIKTNLLHVSHAFHSQLLEPMLEQFKKVLEEIKFNPPTINLISNLTGDVVSGEEISMPQYWLSHTRNTVNFYDGIKTLFKLGMTTFIEIGSHPVLLAMAREISENEELESYYIWALSLRRDVQDWSEILASLAKLYVNGFDINWKNFDKNYGRKKIQLPTYPFQKQKYWVDVDTNKLKERTDSHNLNNYAYDAIWQRQALIDKEAKPSQQKNAWIIFAADFALMTKLSALVDKDNDLIFCINYHDLYQVAKNNDITNDENTKGYTWIDDHNINLYKDNLDTYKDLLEALRSIMHNKNISSSKVVYLCGVNNDEDKSDPVQMQKQVYERALWLVQGLIDKQFKFVRLYLVTNCALPVTHNEKYLSIHQSTLWGLGRTLSMENASLGCTNIDINILNDEDRGVVAHQLWQELNAAVLEDQVAFRGPERMVRRLVKTDLVNSTIKNSDESKSFISSQGSYLITGGLGGLGLIMAQWLIDSGASSLILLGRRKPSEGAAIQIAKWQQLEIKIETAQTDITNAQEVRNLLTTLSTNGHLIKGIIHAAGVLEQSTVVEQSWIKYVDVFSPKIIGALNLHTVVQDLNFNIDFFIHFSSTSAILGNIGHGSYAAANAFLDTFATYQRMHNIPAYSINWGGWKKIDIVKDIEENKNNSSLVGIISIDPEIGVQAMQQIITKYNKENIVITDINWKLYLDNFSNQYNSSFFTEVNPHDEQPITADKTESVLIKTLTKANKIERKKIIINFLLQEIRKTLALPIDQAIDINTPFMNLGIDSLLSVEFASRLRRELGVVSRMALSTNQLFNYPSIESLSKYLLQELFEEDSAVLKNEEIVQQDKTEEFRNLSNEDLAKEVNSTLEKIKMNILAGKKHE